MSRLFLVLATVVILALYAENVDAKWAKCWSGKKRGIVEFGCYGVGKLSDLDKASTNVHSIVYHTSVLPNINGNVFYRFQNSLKYLDLHKCQIETIDPRAFRRLTNLKSLILWGNNLTWIPAEWFQDLGSLKTLDLSFNHISSIDEMAFTQMPKLGNFFIDYNMMRSLNWNVFAYLPNLKKVRMGQNPWNWWYRAMISRQLDEQRVDYTSEWDDYYWLNHVIWNCVENQGGKKDDGAVLDCVSTHFLKERSKISNSLQKITSCDMEAKNLYDCTIRTDQSRNLTITPPIAARKILEGFIGAFNSLQNPDLPFKYRTIN